MAAPSCADQPAQGEACSTDAIVNVMAANLAMALADQPEPGANAAVFIPSRWNTPVALSRGEADYEKNTVLKPTDKLLAGSVGKTFYAAAIFALVDDGRLSLETPIGSILPGADLPNGDVVTVRMLLSHKSGYGEYDATFMEELIKDPLRPRVLGDWTGPLTRNTPGAPGEFRYSDINFVLLAKVIEAVSGETAEDYIVRTIIAPSGLRHTAPATSPRIDGLAPGYAGAGSLFGADKMTDASGALIYNPQFESGGGGFASNATDLARWIVVYAAGPAVSRARWAEASTPTSTDAETGDAYGLGVHIDDTPVGRAFGHSGYIPGYLSFVRYYEKAGVAVAMQINASDDARVTFDGYELIDKIAGDAAARCTQG